MPWRPEKDTRGCSFYIGNTNLNICAACGTYLYFTKTKAANKYKHKKDVRGHKINDQKRYEIFGQHDIILRPNAGLCTKCNDKSIDELVFDRDNFDVQNIQIPECINNIICKQKAEIKQHKQQTHKKPNKGKGRSRINPLPFESLSDEKIKNSCGLTKENLSFVIQHVNQPDHQMYQKVNLNIEDLYITCCVWKQNLSYSFAASIFGFADSSGISHLIDRVVDLLCDYWVSDYIGWEYWIREGVAKHVPDFVNKLHPGKNVVGCIDATYLYKQKAKSDYQFQKSSYCVYKGRNLQKEHVACTPDGKVLVVDGPYFCDGYNNDAKIWDHIVNEADSDIHNIFEGDQSVTFVADRGYRDCLPHDKYKLLIPHGVGKEEHEVKTEDGEVKTKEKKVPLNVKQGAENKFSYQKGMSLHIYINRY